MLRIEKILYPTDLSPSAEQAFGHAIFFAEQFDAELHVLHAVVLAPDDPYNPGYYLDNPDRVFSRIREVSTSAMADLVAPHRNRPLRIVQAQQRGLDPALVALDYMRDHDIDLVVMGTRGRRGLDRLVFGSVAEEMVRRSGCPVVTFHELPEGRSLEPIERILVPIDFSDESREQLRYARELAGVYGARIDLLHVVDVVRYPLTWDPLIMPFPPQKRAEIVDRSEELLGRFFEESDGPSVPYEVLVAQGRAATEIVRGAEELRSDLVVLSTHGTSGLRRLVLGSTAEEVVRTSPCPVFSIHPGGRSLLAPPATQTAAEPATPTI